MTRTAPHCAQAEHETMQIKVFRTLEDFNALAQPWRQLETEVAHTLPFQTFDWNKAWWTCFAVDTRFRQDTLLVNAFFESEKLVGVIPLLSSNFKLGRIVFFRYIRPFGADPNLTEIRSPLVLPGYADVVFIHWLKFISRHGFGIKQYQIIAPSERMDYLIEKNMNVRLINKRTIPNYILNLNSSWDDFRKGLKRNIKESIRRCYNSLSRDGLQHTFEIFSEPEKIMTQLDTFFQLHSARAKIEKKVEHPDYFKKSQHRDFLKKLIIDTDPKNLKVCLFCLRIDTEVSAMRLGFIVGNDLYFYYSGYKPEHGKYSVMTTLVVEVVRWAINEKLNHINLSVGQDVSKTRWSPKEVAYAEYHFSNTSLIGDKLGWLIYNFKKFKIKKSKFFTFSSNQSWFKFFKTALSRLWLKFCILLAGLDGYAELVGL